MIILMSLKWESAKVSFVIIHLIINLGFWFSVKSQSFLVSNPLNNQLDILKFLWRHDFVQDKLDPRCFLKMIDKIPNWCIVIVNHRLIPVLFSFLIKLTEAWSHSVSNLNRLWICYHSELWVNWTLLLNIFLSRIKIFISSSSREYLYRIRLFISELSQNFAIPCKFIVSCLS